MVAAHRQGSVAGKAGSTTTLNGVDQDTKLGQMTLVASHAVSNSGYTGQDAKEPKANAVESGGPKDVANKDGGDGVWQRIKRWWRDNRDLERREFEKWQLEQQREQLRRLAREGRLRIDKDGTVYVTPEFGGPPVAVGQVKPVEIDPRTTPVYRGGTNMEASPRDIRVGADGMVNTTRGVSVNTDPAGLERFGGARQIRSIPDELRIIQRGANPSHYEIVPRTPMTPARFQQLLNQVEFH